jgi:hypothetical protein
MSTDRASAVATTGQSVGSRNERVANAAPLSFTTDGDLIANSRFGVNRWEMNPDLWQETACTTAGRNLTHAEWTEYAGDGPYRATLPAVTRSHRLTPSPAERRPSA